MKTSRILIFYSLLGIATTFACGTSGSGVGCASSFSFSSELQTEIGRVSDASIAYSMDPSTSNCLAYVNALDDYIDALEDFEKCAREAGQAAEWRDALDDLQDNVDTIRDDC